MIAFAAAAMFVAGSRQIPAIARIYWLSGPLYGVAVFIFMNLIVVPLSARPKRPASANVMLVQLLIHILFVGFPIALSTNLFAQTV
jgi:hypothetical protein